MGEDIFPVLATIILVATLITFIVAISSYIVFKIKEKKRQEKGEEVQTDTELSETQDALEDEAAEDVLKTAHRPGGIDPAPEKPLQNKPDAPSEIANAGGVAGVPKTSGPVAASYLPPRTTNYAETNRQSISKPAKPKRTQSGEGRTAKRRSTDPPSDKSHLKRRSTDREYDPERRRSRRETDDVQFDIAEGRRRSDFDIRSRQGDRDRHEQYSQRHERSPDYSRDDNQKREQNLSHAQSTFLNLLQGSEDMDDSGYDNCLDTGREDSRDQHLEFRKFSVPRKQSSNRGRPKGDDDSIKWK